MAHFLPLPRQSSLPVYIVHVIFVQSLVGTIEVYKYDYSKTKGVNSIFVRKFGQMPWEKTEKR